MKLKVKTKAKKAWSRMHRDLARGAAEFAIETFGLQGQGSVLVKLCADYDLQGCAINLDDENFIVRISSSVDASNFIKIIFHEFWHVRQYVYEGLSLEGQAPRFRKEEYTVDVDQCSYDEYWELPWEVEARFAEEETWKLYTK